MTIIFTIGNCFFSKLFVAEIPFCLSLFQHCLSAPSLFCMLSLHVPVIFTPSVHITYSLLSALSFLPYFFFLPLIGCSVFSQASLFSMLKYFVLFSHSKVCSASPTALIHSLSKISFFSVCSLAVKCPWQKSHGQMTSTIAKLFSPL